MINNLWTQLTQNKKTVLILGVALILYTISNADVYGLLLNSLKFIINLCIFAFVAEALVGFADKSFPAIKEKLSKKRLQ